jgi:hypothetical protein
LTNDDTSDGVLVVQVRGLGAIYRDVPQLAARQGLMIRTRGFIPARGFAEERKAGFLGVADQLHARGNAAV